MKLNARIAAGVSGVADLFHQIPRAQGIDDAAVGHRARVPHGVMLHRLHVLVGDPHTVVRVLKENRVIGIAAKRAVIAHFDERPGLFFFINFTVDVFHNVRVVDVEDDHFGGASGFTAGFYNAGKGVKNRA